MQIKKKKYLQKLFFTYSSVVLTVIVLLLLTILIVLYREQYQKSADTKLQLVTKTSEQIDSSLQGMDRIINGLLFNKTFVQIMKEDDDSIYYTDNSRHVLNIFVAMDAPLFPSYRIIAFNNTSYYNLSKSGEDQGYIKSALEGYPFRDRIDAANGGKVILPIHQDTFSAQPSLVYSVARNITDGKNSYGFIEVQNQYEQLADICSLDPSLGSMIVFAENGEQIYPQEDGGPDAAYLFAAIEQSGGATGSFRLGGQHITYSTSPYSGWTTAICIPVSQVVPFGFELIGLIVLAFALFALVTLLLIRYLTKRLTAPLVDLNAALNEVSLDNLSLTLSDDKNIEEIQSINDSFQEMFTHLKEAIAKNVQARANEERANYLALQSQMNPHTIYNTIGMIEAVSYMHGDKEVSNLCRCFSSMLRYISDYSRRDCTVRDEIQHLQDYAILIRKRYEGKLDIEIDVDTGLMNRIIPKFTIQPLVENAVKHGFGSRESLTIKVAVKSGEAGWSILVQDDGCGFSAKALEKVTAQLAHCDESLQANSDIVNGRIGNLSLCNIYIRCRILYGEQFQFTIHNTNAGTGASIALQIKEAEGSE